jgi:hypothetical protein
MSKPRAGRKVERSLLVKTAELAYLRDCQQAVLTRAFVSRIERLLLDHPEMSVRFEKLLSTINSELKLRKVG